MASYNLGKVVGDDGVSLEYDWEGTSLGIKRDDEAEYTYVDLKGEKGDTGSTGASGSNGKDGADGYSPTVSTSKEGKTTTIEITDKNGTHTATIQDGADGSNGVDGTSPTATVSKSGNTATITITDKNGTTTASVSDGINGTDGRDGYIQYTAGSNITIENNVISASGGDIPIYIWDGRPWSSSTPDTNADVKATWDKVIDCLLNGKPYAFYLIQTRKTGSSASTNKRMVFNITLAYTPSSNRLSGGAICFYTGVEYYSYDISILNALDSNNKITSVPDKTVQAIYDHNIAFVYNGSNVGVLTTTNSNSYNPTPNSYNPATTKYVDDNVNPSIITDSGSTYTISSLTGNKTYKLGTLTSLTITATTTFDRESIIYFTSGSTATSVSLPDSITNLGDAPAMTTTSNVNTGTCEASKSYIISILNNIAVWKAY